MYVLAALTCKATLIPDMDHEVDTRSGEAHCAVCGAMTIVEAPELLELLEDA